MKYARKIMLVLCLVTATIGLTACSKLANKLKVTKVIESSVIQTTVIQTIRNKVSYSNGKEVIYASNDSVSTSAIHDQVYGIDNTIKYKLYRNVISFCTLVKSIHIETFNNGLWK